MKYDYEAASYPHCAAWPCAHQHAIAAGSHVPQGPVFSLTALRRHLADEPQAWMGRVLQVRGVLDGCQHVVCPGHEPYLPPRLLDPNPVAPIDPLPVTWGEADPTLALLRTIPVLGRLLPSPQGLHWEVAAIYRIRLQRTSGALCTDHTCSEAVVLDAGPEG